MIVDADALIRWLEAETKRAREAALTYAIQSDREFEHFWLGSTFAFEEVTRKLREGKKKYGETT